MTSYQLVIFDIGGVIVDCDTDRLIHQVAQLLHRSFEEVQAVIYHEALLLPFELGQIKPQTYYEGLRERLKLPWTYAQFVRVWNDIFTENDEVRAIVQRLRAGYKLSALTNTNELHIEYLRATIPSLALFETVTASCEVGLRKPDPHIYRLALTRAGMAAGQAVYVDDRPELVEAGKVVGLTGIRFENSRQLERDLQATGLRF